LVELAKLIEKPIMDFIYCVNEFINLNNYLESTSEDGLEFDSNSI